MSMQSSSISSPATGDSQSIESLIAARKNELRLLKSRRVAQPKKTEISELIDRARLVLGDRGNTTLQGNGGSFRLKYDENGRLDDSGKFTRVRWRDGRPRTAPRRPYSHQNITGGSFTNSGGIGYSTFRGKAGGNGTPFFHGRMKYGERGAEWSSPMLDVALMGNGDGGMHVTGGKHGGITGGGVQPQSLEAEPLTPTFDIGSGTDSNKASGSGVKYRTPARATDEAAAPGNLPGSGNENSDCNYEGIGSDQQHQQQQRQQQRQRTSGEETSGSGVTETTASVQWYQPPAKDVQFDTPNIIERVGSSASASRSSSRGVGGATSAPFNLDESSIREDFGQATPKNDATPALQEEIIALKEEIERGKQSQLAAAARQTELEQELEMEVSHRRSLESSLDRALTTSATPEPASNARREATSPKPNHSLSILMYLIASKTVKADVRWAFSVLKGNEDEAPLPSSLSSSPPLRAPPVLSVSPPSSQPNVLPATTKTTMPKSSSSLRSSRGDAGRPPADSPPLSFGDYSQKSNVMLPPLLVTNDDGDGVADAMGPPASFEKVSFPRPLAFSIKPSAPALSPNPFNPPTNVALLASLGLGRSRSGSSKKRSTPCPRLQP